MPKNFSIFAPFSKVIKTESGGREIWGFATLERVDKSKEIADFDGTLKAFGVWSDEISKNSQGKSKGNIRIMHRPETGGTVTDWQAGSTIIEENGEEKTVKGIWVGSKIPAHKTDVIADIDAGVLSAYSIGGSYAKKWPDAETGATRYIPVMAELSLVDNPCVPGAEFQMIKAATGPWDKTEKEEVVSLNAEQLAKAAAAAGISIEQMTALFAELAKAEKPVDGDGDDDNNKEFPEKDDEAKKDDADAAAEDDGVKKDDMEAAADDDGVTKTAESDIAKSVSDILADMELIKSGAAISEKNRDKLHKAAGHIADTCGCDKCMKAAGIYADPDGTNNGEEPQDPPIKKEADADLQKAVGISFAQELEKAELVKQGDLAKFASEVSEMAKAVASISTTIDAVNKSVEAVGKQVETFEKSANDRLKAIEDTPVQGGPLLYGATGETPNGVQKSAGASEQEALQKAFDATNDSTIKDILGRKLATLEYKNQRQGV